MSLIGENYNGNKVRTPTPCHHLNPSSSSYPSLTSLGTDTDTTVAVVGTQLTKEVSTDRQ